MVTVLLVAAGGATAAHADPGDPDYVPPYYESETQGSYARFIRFGDKFEVCDMAYDFELSYVRYQYVRIGNSVQTGVHYAPGDAGDCQTFDHNFGEKRYVWFRACRDIALTPKDDCAPWRQAIA
ncbi:hypothetical protein OG216_00835 [Streptomycetaceae bacterium NBC_01309]